MAGHEAKGELCTTPSVTVGVIHTQTVCGLRA